MKKLPNKYIQVYNYSCRGRIYCLTLCSDFVVLRGYNHSMQWALPELTLHNSFHLYSDHHTTISSPLCSHPLAYHFSPTHHFSKLKIYFSSSFSIHDHAFVNYGLFGITCHLFWYFSPFRYLFHKLSSIHLCFSALFWFVFCI